MPDRRLPVRPDLTQLKHQAKDLLRALRRGDPEAAADLRRHHPHPPSPGDARLADAQLALARAYGARSWTRLVQACGLVDAIWRDDPEAVRALVERNPALLHESAIIRESHWGPPLSYAANLGRDRIIRLLHAMGATDLRPAIDRAALQGHAETVRMLYAMLGSPPLEPGALGGPAYTLNVAGTALLLTLGARAAEDDGGLLAPVETVLGTDSRDPAAKHAILDLYERHGARLPDTPTMAVHRGRIDRLEAHLARDPGLLRRTFPYAEIFPPSLGCLPDPMMTHGTPLDGATLLHLAIDMDEREIVRWLLERGMDPDARAAVDAEGFGGHTPLFATVVSQPAFWMNYGKGRPQEAPLAELLLARGANPNARASLRKRLHPGYDDDRLVEYRDVTPLAWGERFHAPLFVSRPAMALVAAAGGGR